MKRLIWTLAAAASIAASAAEPPTSDNEAATTVATSPQGQQAPAATNPIAPISDGGRKGREEQQAFDSRWTMIFTGCSATIGTLQLFLFFWQLRLMRASMKDTAESAGAAMAAAKAAELNARAAIGMEIPVLAVQPPELLATNEPVGDGPYGGYVNDGPPTAHSGVGGFRITNHGRTPAFPVHFAAGWQVASALPEIPQYLKATRLNHASILKPEDDLYVDEHYGIDLTAEELLATTEGTQWLWFYGCIRYRDFLGQERNHRFCWRFANRELDGALYYFASDGDPPAAFIEHD
ncbi:hypothetical protein [Cupriavidus necator]